MEPPHIGRRDSAGLKRYLVYFHQFRSTAETYYMPSLTLNQLSSLTCGRQRVLWWKVVQQYRSLAVGFSPTYIHTCVTHNQCQASAAGDEYPFICGRTNHTLLL